MMLFGMVFAHLGEDFSTYTTVRMETVVNILGRDFLEFGDKRGLFFRGLGSSSCEFVL